MFQQTSRLSRRQVIRVAIFGIAGTALAACSSAPAAAPTSAPAAATQPTAAPAAAQPTTAPAATKAPATTPTVAPTTAPAVATKPAATPAAQGATPPKYSGTLSILVSGNFGMTKKQNLSPNAQVVMQLFDMYQKQIQPGVKIKLEELIVPGGQSGWDIIRTRAQAGNIPDVVDSQPVVTLMNTALFYQFPKALFDKPNPYSTNKTWLEDFPYNGVVFESYPGAEPGTFWAVGLTTTGGSGLVGFAYNKQLFEKAGIHQGSSFDGPKSWAEFMQWNQKIKDAGIVPFDAGNHVAGSCCSVWFHSEIYDNLMEPHHKELETTAATFLGQPVTGMLNPYEGTYLIKTKKWTMNNEYQIEYFNLLKQWSQFFRPGFLGMTTKNMFLSGEAAYGYVHLNNIRPYREQLKGKFDWGTFYMPPITSDTWPKAAGAPQRAHAASGLPGGYAGDGFFMVPQQTVKSGNLDRAVDLIQWITAPEQLAYFGKNTEPRSAKVGQTVKEIYPDDPMMQDEYRFHYEPAGILDGMRYGTDEWWHMVGIGAEDGWHKTNQACLAGQMTAEQAAAKLQEIAVQATDRFIQETPNLNPPANTWK